MRRRARTTALATCAFAVLVLAACGGGKSPSASSSPKKVVSSKSFVAADLPKLVLAKTEAPGKTKAEEREEVTLDDFWSCCKEQREKFSTAGYLGGYRAGFQMPNLPEAISDWPSGVAFAKSVVALFKDAKGASTALPVWRGYFEASSRGKAQRLTPGLGDESSGLAGVFFKDHQQMFIYFWRTGNVVFHLRIGGREGTLKEADAVTLAGLMNGRAR